MGFEQPRESAPSSDPFLRREGGGFASNDAPAETELTIAAERREGARCRFEVFRTDEVRMSSSLFSGGDWHWRLSDAAGQTLVEAGGYADEAECRSAVTILQRDAARATGPDDRSAA